MVVDTREEFINYLKKVCKNEKLREYSLAFFDDLINLYEDKLFTRDDFEKIKIYEVETEQDVTKAVFAEKETATIDEIFLYNLKNNINKIDWTKAKSFKKNIDLGGNVNIVKRRLLISKRTNVLVGRTGINPPIRQDCLSEKDYRQKIKQYKTMVENEIQNSFRGTIYHELSHVMEMKTYNNRRFIKAGVNQVLLGLYEKNKGTYMIHGEITKESVNQAKKETMRQKRHRQDQALTNIAEELIKMFSTEGAKALAEIWNETFASKVGKTLHIEPEPTIIGYCFCKTRKADDCCYNKNYNIQKLIELLLDEDKIMMAQFDSKIVVDKIRNLNISEDSIEYINSKIYKLLFEHDKTKERLQEAKRFNKRVRACDTYQRLCILIGFCEVFEKKNDVLTTCQSLAQDLLIEGIRNDIYAKFQDANVIKDEAFFIKIDKMMREIDKVILIPTKTIREFNAFDKGKRLKLPMRYIAKTNKAHKRFQILEKLCEATQEEMTKRGIENIEQSMTYLKRQKKYNLEYEKFLSEQGDGGEERVESRYEPFVPGKPEHFATKQQSHRGAIAKVVEKIDR